MKNNGRCFNIIILNTHLYGDLETSIKGLKGKYAYINHDKSCQDPHHHIYYIPKKRNISVADIEKMFKEHICSNLFVDIAYSDLKTSLSYWIRDEVYSLKDVKSNIAI